MLNVLDKRETDDYGKYFKFNKELFKGFTTEKEKQHYLRINKISK